MDDRFEEIIRQELTVEEDIKTKLSEIRKIVISDEPDDIKLESIKVIFEELQKEIIEAKASAALESRTGLFSAQFGEDYLTKELEKSKRDKTIFCIALIDLDYLKYINDNFGHVLGTKAILEVAEIIKKCVRKSDLVSRYGGDEFLVIFRNADTKKAERAINRIKTSVSEILIDGKARVSLSVGVVEYKGEENETLESILKKVDRKLYQAKEDRVNLNEK